MDMDWHSDRVRGRTVEAGGIISTCVEMGNGSSAIRGAAAADGVRPAAPGDVAPVLPQPQPDVRVSDALSAALAEQARYPTYGRELGRLLYGERPLRTVRQLGVSREADGTVKLHCAQIDCARVSRQVAVACSLFVTDERVCALEKAGALSDEEADALCGFLRMFGQDPPVTLATMAFRSRARDNPRAPQIDGLAQVREVSQARGGVPLEKHRNDVVSCLGPCFLAESHATNFVDTIGRGAAMGRLVVPLASLFMQYAVSLEGVGTVPAGCASAQGAGRGRAPFRVPCRSDWCRVEEAGLYTPTLLSPLQSVEALRAAPRARRRDLGPRFDAEAPAAGVSDGDDDRHGRVRRELREQAVRDRPGRRRRGGRSSRRAARRSRSSSSSSSSSTGSSV